jgi:NTP pyrophosphatase (non-canonical NTP hydrolase)
MIQKVGGYWRPTAGVARLLEELGELSEQLRSTSTDDERQYLAEELADVWIISTCIANQFNVDLAPETLVMHDPTNERAFEDAVSHAGRIARIVNYYDGPKKPRSMESWMPLRPAIIALHHSLYRIADKCLVSLDAAIDSKIARTPARDAGRFTTTYDPSTAGTLLEFAVVRRRTPCPYAKEARLWGAPVWDEKRSLFRNVDSIFPFFLSFTKAARLESLDGFVVALGNVDPEPSPMHLTTIGDKGWQFAFNGLRLFISVFSPLYPRNHPRWSPKVTFITFQPEQSFDFHQIGSTFPESAANKKLIRDSFTHSGFWYPADVIDERIEAAIYLLPRFSDDRDVLWWQEPDHQLKLFDILTSGPNR